MESEPGAEYAAPAGAAAGLNMSIEAILVLLEWAGTLTGVSGSVVMAARRPWSPWGWMLWTVSAVCIAPVALSSGHYGLAGLNAFFASINAFGTYTWLVSPWLKARTQAVIIDRGELA